MWSACCDKSANVLHTRARARAHTHRQTPPTLLQCCIVKTHRAPHTHYYYGWETRRPRRLWLRRQHLCNRRLLLSPRSTDPRTKVGTILGGQGTTTLEMPTTVHQFTSTACVMPCYAVPCHIWRINLLGTMLCCGGKAPFPPSQCKCD